MMAFNEWIYKTILNDIYIPEVRFVDFVEILLIAFLIYKVIVWIKNTKAWMLLRGILVLAVFILFAYAFKMYTVMWLAETLIPVLATGVVIIFQPELRRVLEKLGESEFIYSIMPFESNGKEKTKFSDDTINGIVRAVYTMGAVKTGALIVIERAIKLTEYESTGIQLDCIVSPQILINIFEHNTPLHDGAIIIRGDRIVSATCYLPLSDNSSISKELGTRHRAAIGMSEVSDALIIVVSEETGQVSVAEGGKLQRDILPEQLRECIEALQIKTVDTKGINQLLKGWGKDEKAIDE